MTATTPVFTQLIFFIFIACDSALCMEGWNTVKYIPLSYAHVSSQNILRCEKICERQEKCSATTFDNRERICYMHESCVKTPEIELNTRGRYLYKKYKEKTAEQGANTTCDANTEIAVPSIQAGIGACHNMQDRNYHNVALKKPSWQSSTHTKYVRAASEAVDGSRNPDYWCGSCTHTKEEENPWWIVDLQDMYSVASVVIAGRDKWGRRLHNFTAEVASEMASKRDFSQFRVCSYYPGKANNSQVLKLNCSLCTPVQFVKVQVFDPTPTILTLCEVEVYQLEQERHCNPEL